MWRIEKRIHFGSSSSWWGRHSRGNGLWLWLQQLAHIEMNQEAERGPEAGAAINLKVCLHTPVTHQVAQVPETTSRAMDQYLNTWACEGHVCPNCTDQLHGRRCFMAFCQAGAGAGVWSQWGVRGHTCGILGGIHNGGCSAWSHE